MKNRIYKKPFKPDYITSIARRLRKEETPAEAKLWNYLKNRKFMGLKFRRQVPFGRYVIDFYCKEQNLAVEIDGEYHQDVKVYDRNRKDFLESSKIRILRFNNKNVLGNIETVLKALEEVII